MTNISLYTIELYKGNKKLTFSITNSGESLICNNLVVSKTQLDLLRNFGITQYPTQPLLVFKDEILTLFDQTKQLYFDGRQNRNIWVVENPTPYYNTPFIINSNVESLEQNILNIETTDCYVNHTFYIDNEEKKQAIYFYNLVGTPIISQDITVEIINIDIEN